MMQSAPLVLTHPQLGAFEFSYAEVPDQITFGGQQLIAEHIMIGGAKVVNAMGASDAPLSWRGVFLNATATDRAIALDTIRRMGDTCTLTWAGFDYDVVVSQFSADFQKPYRIPYTITCMVEKDNVAWSASVPSTNPINAVQSDFWALSALPGLPSSLSGISSAVSALQNAVAPVAQGLTVVTSGAQQAASTISGLASQVTNAAQAIVAPLAAFSQQVGSSILSAEASVTQIASLGGVLPTGPIAQRVGQIISGANAAINLPTLYQMSGLASRIGANAALVTTPAARQQIVTGGGTLFGLASSVYGDQSRWQAIAAANGLTDPNLAGITRLRIP